MDTLLSSGKMSQVDEAVPWSVLQLVYLFVLTVTLFCMLQKPSSATGHISDNMEIKPLILF